MDAVFFARIDIQDTKGGNHEKENATTKLDIYAFFTSIVCESVGMSKEACRKYSFYRRSNTDVC